jgi:hypothetical protein
MKKFIVLDDVLDEETRIAVRDFSYGPALPQKWYDYGVSPIHEKIIDVARDYFDLSDTIGYEMWCNQRAVGWHYDHDEVKSKENNTFVFPPVAIAYYAEVTNLEGGDFVSETHRITPITNRIIMFSPGLYHGVYPYSGIRKAISINPWSYKIENKI